jgi:hypothetical protein
MGTSKIGIPGYCSELCHKTARVKFEGASTIFQNEYSLNVSIALKKWAAQRKNSQPSDN